MTIAVSAIGAILPSLLLIWFFYKRDIHPEPRGVLIKTFLLGVLTVIPVLIVAIPVMLFAPVNTHPLLIGCFVAFCCAAIPEEFFKFVVLTRYSARNTAFDEPMDGVVYGVTASLGFATLENILYVLGSGWTIAITRAFTAVPMHAFLGAIVGYYVGQARFNPRLGITAWRGLRMAILLHGLYDVGLLTVLHMGARGTFDAKEPPGDQIALALGMLALSLVAFIIAGVWALRIVRRLRREQLQAVGIIK